MASKRAPDLPAGAQDLTSLTPDPQNRRAHNHRNIEQIASSLQKVGAARSIVIDEAGVVLAGNGVMEAAQHAGIEKVLIIDAAGDQLVAVRRSGLTDEQKRHLAIADNRSAELAEWNIPQLQADNDSGLDLTSFFTDAELSKVLELPEPAEPRQTVSFEASKKQPAVLVRCKSPRDQAKCLKALTDLGYTCEATQAKA